MQINDSLQMKQTNDEVLILVNLITDRYLGLSVYIATLGSWSNGFMHYDQTPNICFSWSRSHAFGKIKKIKNVHQAPSFCKDIQNLERRQSRNLHLNMNNRKNEEKKINFCQKNTMPRGVQTRTSRPVLVCMVFVCCILCIIVYCADKF